MERILVAAGVLRDASGRVLLARRPESSHQGGLWEFPGGKVEPGESVREALQRELREELGIGIQACRPLIRVSHRYADLHVVLDTWLVSGWRGVPRGREGQPLQWLALRDVDAGILPAADLPILGALRLPTRYVITPPRVEEPRTFLEQLDGTLDLGVKLVQFRVFGLERPAWRRLAREAQGLCRERGARLLLNAPLQEVSKLGAQGLHLDSRQLMALDSLQAVQGRLVGASCHDARELEKAEALGVDFVVLSPVLPTASHPATEPMGWEAFSRLVEKSNLPVYALGGMQPGLLEQAWRQGAQGIAGISGLWRST